MSYPKYLLSLKFKSSFTNPNARNLRSLTFSRQFSEKTHFGFEEVSKEEKPFRVSQVFTSVAQNYDKMNDFMSFGLHRHWKDVFVSHLSPQPGSNFLDIASGSGDIGFRIIDKLKAYPRSLLKERPTSIILSDINSDMLSVCKQRALERNYLVEEEPKIEFRVIDAEDLSSIESNSIDYYSISFGLRNCTNIDKVLKEAYRVLKPNAGRILCLEFSHIQEHSLPSLPFLPQQTNSSIFPIVNSVYDFYSFSVIPTLGQLVAQDYQSYKYLVESIRKFPNQEELKSKFEEAGFKYVTYENLTMGVVAIHSGFKLENEK